MKKSALSLFVGATVVLTSLLGCDAVKSDLSQYSKTAVPVYNDYSEKIAAKAAEGGKATSAEEYLAKNKEIIAQLDEFRSKLDAVKPETKDVQDLNQSCIANLKNLEDGYKQLGEAIEKQDEALSQTAKTNIQNAVKADEKFRSDLSALEEKHHVQVK